MPKRRPTAPGGSKKQNAPVLGLPELSSLPIESGPLHRTRGWLKSQAEIAQASKPPSAPILTESTRPAGDDTIPSISQRPLRRTKANKDTVEANVAPISTPSSQTSQWLPQRLKDLYFRKDQNLLLTNWLRRIDPSCTIDRSFHDVQVSEGSREEMEVSASASTASKEAPSENTTVKGKLGQKPVKLNWDRLRRREIDVRASTDPRGKEFEALFHPKLLKLDSKKVEELKAKLKAFLDLPTKRIDHAQIESLSDEFDKWKSQVNLATITEKHFQNDVAWCSFSNEAILQRTIMMEIIDRHQLHEFLIFNCEGIWNQNKGNCLISKDVFQISFPKPDLNISFQLQSFNETAAIPPSLDKSFRPDSAGQMNGRCFPFLFFEVKKSKESLERAEMANLNNASQALWNIYGWMLRARKTEDFFAKVRVFSFVFNVEALMVRMHRATPHDTTGLQYHFSEVRMLRGYPKTEVCLMLRKILQEYAVDKLHPILKATFDVVIEEYESEVLAERRGDFEQATAAQRASHRGTPSMPVPLQDSQSFGFSTLTTT